MLFRSEGEDEGVFGGDCLGRIGVGGRGVEVGAEGGSAPVVGFFRHEGLGFAGAEVAAGEGEGVERRSGCEGEESEEGDG